MQTIKLIAKFLISYLILLYIVGFSSLQSLVISSLVIFIYEKLKHLEKVETFSPIQVQILPNWHKLLKDYKLVDDKKWEVIEKEVYGSGTSYNVLRQGVSFTIVRTDNQGNDLIFDNNHNVFATKVDFRERIEELKEKGKGLLGYTPEFYVKQDINGYEIGISTPESFENVLINGDDNELIKVATLPYASLGLWKYADMKFEDKDKIAKDFGWSKDETHEKWREDVLYDVPDQLEHKYFTAYFRYI